MYEYDFQIEKVIDGDSVRGAIDLGFNVVMEYQNVRLKGIDTPETRLDSNIDEEYQEEMKAFGRMIKDYVVTQFDESHVRITTTIDKSQDKYGRILADFQLKYHGSGLWVSLNQLLVDQRFAVAYSGENKSTISAQHIENLIYHKSQLIYIK